MSLVASAILAVERAPLPDPVMRLGIRLLIDRTRRRLAPAPEAEEIAFAEDMSNFPIALHVSEANEQHYELPARFFELALGPRQKYSCCYYENPNASLADAEVRALAQTVMHADLADGQTILELGCGWGSLSLYMAEAFPGARITAVSNSGSQRLHVEEQARRRNLRNLQVFTADMNEFSTTERFDRVVSVEMFEHMSNWRELLGRIRNWLRPQGRLFIHVFTHRERPYRFDHADKTDWIARHFFTGGIMPSHRLMRRFEDLFVIEQEWRWNGLHYQRTAQHWLANFDANRGEIDRVLAQVYGPDAALWRKRWRLFFLATAGLFGDNDGDEWGVSHYRLRPAANG
jgi:cyclopropane-fatty-acyl-phospholipid synthase